MLKVCYLEAPIAPTLIEPVADKATKIEIIGAAGPKVLKAKVYNRIKKGKNHFIYAMNPNNN